MSYTILLVEDNPHIMEINREALIMEDFGVVEATNGKACMEVLRTHDVDMIVLDIMLPDSDGLTLCRQIKAQYDIPILFLSALGENEQIIQGLRSGGDDYLPKPYDIRVLVARIEARLRASQRRKRFMTFSGLKLDTALLTAYSGETDLLLSQKEYLLLLTLLGNPNRPIEKEELYSAVWGMAAGGDMSALHTTISRLNKKLESAGKRVSHRRGEGYALEEI
ncbi:MAG: response regulator transcription factor [Clostridia bacterium]|nr:response regulator transcription factor [Clostridia bacterium]MBR6187235.1 response regulator transcription factor [Clostridia bacterium]